MSDKSLRKLEDDALFFSDSLIMAGHRTAVAKRSFEDAHQDEQRLLEKAREAIRALSRCVALQTSPEPKGEQTT